MLQNAVKMLLSWCYHLAFVFGLPEIVLDDLDFSSLEPSSENKHACIISIKVPLSAFVSLRKEKVVLNTAPVMICYFKFFPRRSSE